MITDVCFTGAKRLGREAHLYLMPRLRMREATRPFNIALCDAKRQAH